MLNTGMVAQYGAEALEHLRQAKLMLQAVSAVGRLEEMPWAAQTEEWYATVSSLVALVEDTSFACDLKERKEKPKLTVRETLEQAIREHRGVFLRVERKDGRVEDVAYEPYGFRLSQREGGCLLAWHVEHEHVERIPLHRIRYIIGIGEVFEPRWDVEVES